MHQLRTLFPITFADFVVRSAYQMGKSPLLPIFAASLGANDVFLGLIVSISTCTGMLLKPLIGAFSDIFGRRFWLLVGTTFFVVMPFVYQFVHIVSIGLMLLGISLPFVLYVNNYLYLITAFIVMGLSQALIVPSMMALVFKGADKNSVGATFGLVGTLVNAGKVLGPIIAGVLINWLQYSMTFQVIGVFLVLVALGLWGGKKAESLF